MTDTAAASRAPVGGLSGVDAGEQREAGCDGSRAPVGGLSGVDAGEQREAGCDGSRAPVGGLSGVDSAQVDSAQVAALAEPLAGEVGCALYDVQWRGGTLVVLATASCGGRIGVDTLSKLSRRLSAALDAADVGGSYVLEVSSPGLERRLRRPDHFLGAVGERVVIRTSTPPRQRIVGEIVGADAAAVSVRVEETPGGAAPEHAPRAGIGQTVAVPYDHIAKARTTFDWGAPPRRTSGDGKRSGSPSGKQGR